MSLIEVEKGLFSMVINGRNWRDKEHRRGKAGNFNSNYFEDRARLDRFLAFI